MLASEYNTYKDYCKAKAIKGFQVIPETLWEGLKQEKYIDIWALNDTERGNLKPGAFITAGPNGNRGIWCGITKSGSCVAAWEGNFKNNRKASEYIKDLMDYAKR
tara:strand:+ start:239 stop:553 length:315 start_codon:yes stop_codon:yes gene_type:complete